MFSDFLPEIYDMPFVNTNDFDIKKLTIEKSKSQKGSPYTFMYKYKDIQVFASKRNVPVPMYTISQS